MTLFDPILIFDLDDTLYDELSYARSGLHAVARYIEITKQIEYDTILQLLLKSLELGRSNVLDRAFEWAGINSKRLVRESLSVYRLHFPDITLFEEAERCLERFSRWRKFIVTDGNVNTQSRKISALNLDPHMEGVYLTYRYGHKCGKPSPYCFELISKRTGKKPQEIIYIADNPTKDFVGIRPLGYKTIRVGTGQYKHIAASYNHDAEFKVQNLDKLTEDMIRNILP